MQTPWHDIEDAVAGALSALFEAGVPLLATVRARTARERKVTLASLARERFPAAYVAVSGRDSGDKDHRRAGLALLTVVYACRSERQDDEARRGGSDVVGVLTIVQAAAMALQDLALPGGRRLLLIDEHAVGGEEGSALWEQRYEVRRESGSLVPRFGGIDVGGADSRVEVCVGELRRAVSLFAFPGVDGVFERFAGTRERSIVWRGQLRAADDAALNAIEEGLEDLVRRAEVNSVRDSWSRTFDHCVARSYRRVGARGCDDLTGQAVQAFELEFVQLSQ